MRAGPRGRSSFGMLDMGRLGGATTGRGAPKKMPGRCHYCQREGHCKAECLKRKADEAGNRFKSEGGGQTAFTATIAKRKASEDWIIDSGASQHISARRERFANYSPISPLKIQIGDGSEIEAIGMGDISLQTEASEITLRDVLYVPTIGSNLLSVAKVVDHGHRMLFTTTGCQIQGTKGRVNGVREGNVYLLREKKIAHVALSNKDVAVTAETWHRRLGHRNFDATAREVIRKAVVGLDIKELILNEAMEGKNALQGVCQTCAAGRQHRETMTGVRQKATTLLETIHSDICGPMRTPTPSGERYFVTFIDEASGRLAVALLRSKGEVFDNFVIYRRRAEKDTGKAIRNLRSDGGGEYLNEKFLTYLRDAGIVKQTTPPYTPAQNGIAERANRTIMETARCMLSDSGLGTEFWGYAVLAATHILNRMPSRVHQNKSPVENWAGVRPSIAHFRVFGSSVHVLVPAETRRKLDPKSVLCKFIGYAEDQGTRVYKLYHKETGKTLISRDVVFDEAHREHYDQRAQGNLEKDLAITPLEENLFQKMISQHLDESSPERKNPQQNSEAISNLRLDDPETPEDDSEFEDTITVRGPVLPLPVRAPRVAQSLPTTTDQPSSSEHQATTEESVSRRPQRARKGVDHFKPGVWKAMVATTAEEPATLADALTSDKSSEWIGAWESELKSLEDNGTWVIEDLPEGKTTIGCRWVFKRKEDGRYKARLVAKGYSQSPGSISTRLSLP